MKLFYACFVALMTTAFGFILRAVILPDWGREFDLTQTQLGEIAGEPGVAAVLDLSDVSFLDSVGLGVILKAAGRFRRQAKRLVIVVPPGPGFWL